MKFCRKCLTEWDNPGQPAFRAVCGKCGCDLHSCINCEFYDIARSSQCRNEVQEPVINKDLANYCEEFRIADKTLPSVQKKNTEERKAKDRFNKLFGS